MKATLLPGLLSAAIAAAGMARAEDGLDVQYQPLHFGGVQEFGLINDVLFSVPFGQFESEWIDHFGTYFYQDAVVNGSLALNLGLGGVFQFGKHEKSQEKFGGSQYKMFFVGPAIAKGMYHFGGVDQGAFAVGGGMFPYKYNPDAVNLGEYLFRSGAYPTYIYTGGLTYVNDNSAYLQGLQSTFKAGGLSMDLVLLTETNLPPLYDFSLGLLAKYTVGDGLFEIGAGVLQKRLIPVNKERTIPKAASNSYFTRAGKDYVGNVEYYQNRADVANRLADTAAAHGNTALEAGYRAVAAENQMPADSLGLAFTQGGWLDTVKGTDDKPLVVGAKYFSPASTLLMGRFSLDFKKLFGAGNMSPQDFRLYGEVAVLGLKKYPVYYEKITDRMPMMIGFNVPTFGLLDLFSIQMEYFNSPNLNNTYMVGQYNFAVPIQPDASFPLFSDKEYLDLVKDDNIYWSINVKKQLVSSVTLSAQFARDHLRTVNPELFFGSRVEGGEVLYHNSSWYWMFQLGWNI